MNPPALAASLRLARVAFTGRLASMTRTEAAGIVSAAGGTPVADVSRRVSMLVVGMHGWPLLPDGSVSRKLRRAEQLNRRGSRIEIVSEAVFLERAGLSQRRPELRKGYPAARVCALLGIEPEALDRWEQFGLVRAPDGLYDFQDLVSLGTIADLINRGVNPATITRSVQGLASVLPGTERPLSQLKIVVEHSKTLLAELGDALVAPDGQLVMDYREGPSLKGRPTPVGATLKESFPGCEYGGAGVPTPSESAETWFERGLRFEEEDRHTEAAEAYRAALALEPRFADAHFNLGNVLRELGKADAAEERFRMGLAEDSAMPEAWFNLADLLEETGRLDEAIDCLERALEVCPTYADAHFNLAYCCEQSDRREQAAKHWSAYLKLDPTSEWAQEARRHLAQRGRDT